MRKKSNESMKEEYLSYLHYRMCNQNSGIRVIGMRYDPLTKDSIPTMDKAIPILDALGHETIIRNITEYWYPRIAVIFDYEPKKGESREQFEERIREITNQMHEDGLEFVMYSHKGRGYHIHAYFPDFQELPDEEVKQRREFLLDIYDAELGKAGNMSITIPFAIHRKTGKPKLPINIKPSSIEELFPINSFNLFREEYELYHDKQAEKHEILPLLEEAEPATNYLDLGFVNLPDGKSIFYYGFLLGGREAIITSDRRILRNTLVATKVKGEWTYTGENQIKNLFTYQDTLGEIAPIISKATVKKFYSENPLINPKSVYQQVRDQILHYMDFPGIDGSSCDEIADVLACWIIGTYCYPLFYWFPHILFNAPSQSGKSKAARVIMQLAFRGFDLGASAGVSPPQIFRTLAGNRGTIIIDEFEKKEGGSRQSSDTQQLVLQLLNASASNDAYVIRTEQVNKKWKAWKFPIFSPKIVCNISGINPTSLSRFIAFKWLKTQSVKGKRKPDKPADKKTFEPIRENLYLMILQSWSQIKGIYDTLDIPELKNREEDSWLPILSVARFIDSFPGEPLKVENQVRKYLNNYQEVSIETDDPTEDFLNALYDAAPDESAQYTPKQIAEFEKVQQVLSYLKSPPHWIGKKLTLYNLKHITTHGQKQYLLSKESINKIIEIYYGTKEMPPNTTNNTQQHQSHPTTPERVALGGIGCITAECHKDPESKEKKPLLIKFPLIDVIRNLDELNHNNGADESSIIQEAEKKNVPESWIHCNLKFLREQGDVLEFKPGFWKVLQ